MNLAGRSAPPELSSPPAFMKRKQGGALLIFPVRKKPHTLYFFVYGDADFGEDVG